MKKGETLGSKIICYKNTCELALNIVCKVVSFTAWRCKKDHSRILHPREAYVVAIFTLMGSLTYMHRLMIVFVVSES